MHRFAIPDIVVIYNSKMQCICLYFVCVVYSIYNSFSFIPMKSVFLGCHDKI